MNSRLRLLLIVAILIIIIGVVVAFVLPRNPGTPGTGDGTPSVQRTQGAAVVTALPTYTDIPMVDIVVAIQPINRGQVITPDVIGYRSWPEEAAPLSAITDIETVIGKIARTDIYRESPITNVVITENLNDLGAVGSDAAAILPAGTRMVSLPIDRLTSAGYALQPGDRVDMIISLLYVDVDEDFQSLLPNDRYYFLVSAEGELIIGGPFPGRDEPGTLAGLPTTLLLAPQEQARPRLTTQMTVQNALVVYVGTFPENGRIFGIGQTTPVPVPEEAAPTAEGVVEPAPGTTGTPQATAAPLRPDIISLAVSPQEAVLLAYYVESKIPVTFALRPASETGTASTRAVTLDYIMGAYAIEVPARRPYSVEPAIRSIRQLIGGEVIELRDDTPPTPAPTASGG